MGYSYSASLNAFFHTDVPDEGVPNDAQAITDELHADLVLKQAQGMRIHPGSGGQPLAVAREATSAIVAAVE